MNPLHSKNFFREIFEKGITPGLVWKMILGFTLCGMLAIAAWAFFTYTWATQVDSLDETPTTGKNTRDDFSMKDVDSVISFYQDKRSAFDALHQSAPTTTPEPHVIGVKTTTAD